MQPDLPEEARALGMLLYVYREQHPLTDPRGGKKLLIALLFLLLGTCTLLFVFLRGTRGHGLDLYNGAFYFISASISLVFSLRFLASSLGKHQQYIFLLSNGLAFVDGATSMAHSWDSVRGIRHTYIYEGPLSSTHQEYTIEFEDGSELSLDERFPKLKTIAEHIQNKCAPQLYKRYLEQLLAGVPLVFGNIRLDREGMTINEKNFLP